jgi:hypothetical protein
MGDRADDSLAAFIHRDALDVDALLPLAAIALESLDLGGEGAGQPN